MPARSRSTVSLILGLALAAGIAPIASAQSFTGTGSNFVDDSLGNGNANGRVDPGEAGIGLLITIQSDSAQSGIIGTLTSGTPTVVVTGGSAAYPDLPGAGTAVNATPFFLAVAGAHPCTDPILLTLSVTATSGGTGTYQFALPTGQIALGPPVTFTYTGPRVLIPDSSPSGVNVTLMVSGAGTVGSVQFTIGGTTCSTAVGATTVGLDHSWVGDLVLTLRDPTGRSVVLASRPGGTNNSGNNFCQTVFDDAAASLIQTIPIAGAPWTGSWRPAGSLSVFTGTNPNGTWTFNAADLVPIDTGSIRAFSLTIRPRTGSSCSPPCGAVPVITLQPASHVVYAPHQTTFTVAAAGGVGALTYQWRRGETPLLDGLGVSGSTTPTLTINPTDASFAGSYSCVVHGTPCGGVMSNAATLTVLQCTADWNQDGRVTPADIAGFVSDWFTQLSGGC